MTHMTFRATLPNVSASPSSTALIAQNATRLREDKKISRETLAQDMGWSMDKVRAFELGLVDLALDDIDALAAALAAKPHDLFA